MKHTCGKKVAFGVVVVVVIYVEFISYVMNSRRWPSLPQEDEGGGGETLRVLFIADPQILGESNENRFFGWLTRWDADKYLQRNYFLAKSHVKPHVVAFLGDLFDEGYKAKDAEYGRYYERFASIFELPRKQNPADLEYLFVSGDNDVGGEGAPVDYNKLKWFNHTFGDMMKPLIYKKQGWDVQFLKMNLFVPEEYQNSLKHHELLDESIDFRIIISHNPLLKLNTSSVEKIVNLLLPNVIFSAHTHDSSHHELTSIKKGQEVLVKEQFLLLREESVFSSFIGKRNQEIRPVQEFNVPTCSYRMGVPAMGFGAFALRKL